MQIITREYVTEKVAFMNNTIKTLKPQRISQITDKSLKHIINILWLKEYDQDLQRIKAILNEFYAPF